MWEMNMKSEKYNSLVQNKYTGGGYFSVNNIRIPNGMQLFVYLNEKLYQ